MAQFSLPYLTTTVASMPTSVQLADRIITVPTAVELVNLTCILENVSRRMEVVRAISGGKFS